MATVVPERLLPGGSARPRDENDDEDALERVSQAKQVSAANGRRNVPIPSADLKRRRGDFGGGREYLRRFVAPAYVALLPDAAPERQQRPQIGPPEIPPSPGERQRSRS